MLPSLTRMPPVVVPALPANVLLLTNTVAPSLTSIAPAEAALGPQTDQVMKAVHQRHLTPRQASE